MAFPTESFVDFAVDLLRFNCDVTALLSREVTADRSDSSGKQRAPRLPAPTVCEKPFQPTQVMNDSPNQSIDNFKGWYTILKILAHRKKSSRMFYKVLWEDLTTSWVKEDYVTALATDRYWLERHEQAKIRKKHDKKTMSCEY